MKIKGRIVEYSRNFLSWYSHCLHSKEEDLKVKKEVEKDFLSKNKAWINKLNPLKGINKYIWCAWFDNNSWGDRGDPICSQIKDIIFKVGNFKKNIWVGKEMLTIIKINKNYYLESYIKGIKK